MKQPNRNHLGLCASGILASLSCTAGAATIFTEDFNSYSGDQNTTQYETGLKVAFGGDVAGWSKSGDGTMHSVDLSGSGNWAIMFWQNNVITQAIGIAANVSSTSYEVNFDYGTAVYAATNTDQRTLIGDELLVEVLRADDSVLASQSFLPGAWDDAGNHNLDGGLQGTLPYVGDGTGDVRLRIGPAAGTLNQGRFAGEIDNLSVNLIPEPSSAALLGLGGLALVLRRRRSA
ncbi:MAG: PEP-CTERM sorting domain-containing protein [Akkermansiaceae bacterium]|nr:PEP-CTERM sorting domain-containing protein [Akkermansiaceae bacterium]